MSVVSVWSCNLFDGGSSTKQDFWPKIYVLKRTSSFLKIQIKLGMILENNLVPNNKVIKIWFNKVCAPKYLVCICLKNQKESNDSWHRKFPLTLLYPGFSIGYFNFLVSGYLASQICLDIHVSGYPTIRIPHFYVIVTLVSN